jgi:ABC-type nitrate/sulfonate/bicarbonate transport system substrate-binding protein
MKKRIKARSLWVTLFVVLLLSMFGCSSGEAGQEETSAGQIEQVKTEEASQAEAGDPVKVSVVLDWSPNTNHTGLYAAKQMGYFAEEGLDVDIVLPGAASADTAVASGEARFGVSYQEGVTLARTQGVPLVSIAAVIQHNTSGFASPKGLGIATPKDFEGRTYGGWGSPVEGAMIESLMKDAGADYSKVKQVSIGENDFFSAQKQGIDFQWIYYGWTGIESELRNEPLNMVWLKDYSKKLDYYTPVLVTNETMIADQPEIVGKFVRAASRGYQYAVSNPEDAANALLEAVPELNRELVVASAKWLSSKYIDDAPRWGEQKVEVWSNYAEWMKERGLMEGEFDPAKAFTNDFLP